MSQQAPLPADVVAMLRCPVTRDKLRLESDMLVAECGLKYPIREGIPVLLPDEAILPPGVADLETFRASLRK